MITKLRGKVSAKNIVLLVAYLTLFCTIIAQCSLTIKMHQCTHLKDNNFCGFFDKDFLDLNDVNDDDLADWLKAVKNVGNTDDLKKNNNHVNAINGLAIFNLIMVLLLVSVQVVIRV